jgi:hypothetical protein
VCTQCKQELAADWFAISRSSLSGRCSDCRLDPGALTLACLGMCLLHLTSVPSLHIRHSYAACHTPTHAKEKEVHPVAACPDIKSTAGNLLAGRVHLKTSGNVGQPYARRHQPCQVRRSERSVSRYAQCQAFTRLTLDVSALLLDNSNQDELQCCSRHMRMLLAWEKTSMYCR